MTNPIVVLAGVIAVFVILTAASAPAHDYMAEMDQLERQALEQSFIRHMGNLFDVYMREPEPDPTRPIAGAEKLRKFYVAIMKELDKREAERKAQ